MPEAKSFSPEAEAEIGRLIDRYETRKSCIIPALHLAQKEFGWIDEPAKDLVAERLEVPRQQVEGVTSFYTMFHKKPVGRYHIQVCGGLPCRLLYADGVVAYIEKKLDIKLGEVSEDGKWSLAWAECLGSCGTGPVLQINNDKYHEELTPEKVDQILDSLT